MECYTEHCPFGQPTPNRNKCSVRKNLHPKVHVFSHADQSDYVQVGERGDKARRFSGQNAGWNKCVAGAAAIGIASW